MILADQLGVSQGENRHQREGNEKNEGDRSQSTIGNELLLAARSLSEIEFLKRRINNLRASYGLQVVDSSSEKVSFRHTPSQVPYLVRQRRQVRVLEPALFN